MEYNGYSCVAPYGTQDTLIPVSRSIMTADAHIQNTVVNYGCSNEYKAGAEYLTKMNLFSNHPQI